MTSVSLPPVDPRADRPWVSVEPDGFEKATVLLAVAGVISVGVDFRLALGATPALLVGAALGPIWISSLRRYPLAPTIAVLGVAAAVAGLWLSRLSAVDHAINSRLRIEAIVLLFSGLASLGLILWARTRLPLHQIVSLYGASALVSALVQGSTSWKFDLAIPTTLLVLGVAERRGGRVVPAAVVILLGTIGVLDEGRSYFGFCVLAATLTFWQLRPGKGETDKRANRWFPAVMMAGIAASFYFLASALLTGGYLGTTLQERSISQVESAGSLLAGGRPEWAATRELFKLNPLGFGAGVVPSWADLEAGTSGLASINIDAGGYTNNYMFGGQFRLHSVAADLWVSFGVVGLVLAGVIVFAIVRSLSSLIAERRAATSVIFTSALGLWYLLFGPIYSNWDEVCLALGLVLLMRANDAASGETPSSRARESASERP